MSYTEGLRTYLLNELPPSASFEGSKMKRLRRFRLSFCRFTLRFSRFLALPLVLNRTTSILEYSGGSFERMYIIYPSLLSSSFLDSLVS